MLNWIQPTNWDFLIFCLLTPLCISKEPSAYAMLLNTVKYYYVINSSMSLYSLWPTLWVANYCTGIVYCFAFFCLVSYFPSFLTLPFMIYLTLALIFMLCYKEGCCLSWRAGGITHLQFCCVIWVFKSFSVSIWIPGLQKSGSIMVLPMISFAVIPVKQSAPLNQWLSLRQPWQ